MEKRYGTRTIYAHFPPFEVRPKVKPRLWKSRTDGWCCGFKESMHVFGGRTPADAYQGWISAFKQFN